MPGDGQDGQDLACSEGSLPATQEESQELNEVEDTQETAPTQVSEADDGDAAVRREDGREAQTHAPLPPVSRPTSKQRDPAKKVKKMSQSE